MISGSQSTQYFYFIDFIDKNNRRKHTRAYEKRRGFMSKSLLVVDVQNGFVNEHTAHIPDMVEQLQHNFDILPALKDEDSLCC